MSPGWQTRGSREQYMGIDRARTVQLVEDYRDRRAWNAFVRDSPFGHLFQTHEWGELQIGLGGQPSRIAAVDDQGRLAGVVQILIFDTGARIFAYVPRGPVCDPEDADLVDAL